MNLKTLRYLLCLAQTRHFGRAAERCHVSTPTLSVAIKNLESELGVALFERAPNRVTITPEGERVVAQAQQILDQVDALRALAREARDQLHGPLHVGLIYTIGPYLLPSLIPALREHAPHMPLVIEEGFTAQLGERLRLGELDAVVLSLPFRAPGVLTLPLYEEPFVSLLPVAHPLTRKTRVTMAELREDEFLLLSSGHCFRDQLLAFEPDLAGSAPAAGTHQVTLEAQSLETIRHMVASGLGVTVVPCSAAGTAQYAQRLIAIRRLQAPEPTRTVALAWRTGFTRPKAIEVLRRALLSALPGCVRAIEGGR